MLKKSLVFYFLIFIFLAVFSAQFLKSKYEFGSHRLILGSVNIILEINKADVNDFLIQTQKGYFDFKKIKNTFNFATQKNTDEIYLLVKKGKKDRIKKVIVFDEMNSFSFENLNNIKYSETQVCSKDSCDDYNQYSFSKYLKQNKNTLNYASNLILSAFLSNPYCLASYFLLFFLIFYFINNKKEIKIPKIKAIHITLILFLGAILLRFCDLFYFFPWLDELYSIDASSGNILNSFKDAGNPPFFYLIYRIYLFVFGFSIYSVKLFPFIISIISIYCFWHFLKKEFDEKLANLGLFLFAINIPLIYFSQEIRSYTLQVLISILIIYNLFKIINSDNKKYYISYFILSLIAINTHFYEILFVFGNLIFVLFIFINQKNYKKSTEFLALNILSFAGFLPYFFYTMLNQSIFVSEFNNWIPKADFFQVQKCLNFVFGNIFSVILTLIFYKKTIFDKNTSSKDKLYINYCFYIMTFVFVVSYIISQFRPIMYERYFTFLIVIFIIYFALIYKNNKKYYIIFLIWILLIQINNNLLNNHKKNSLNITNNMAYQNKLIEKNKNHYVILSLFKLDGNPFLEKINFKKEGIIYKLTFNKKLNSTIDKILKNDKNAVIFTSNIKTNIENLALPYNYTCYFNSTSDTCIWKIEN